MTAQRLVENCVLTNQTAVVDEMLNKHLLPEEYIYPFLGSVSNSVSGVSLQTF